MSYTAAITGGYKGIGGDLAQCLLERGYTLVSIAPHTVEMNHQTFHNELANPLDP